MTMPTRLVFTAYEKLVIRALAVSSATCSVVAGLLMTYWYCRLRNKTFRHQLVMLLIISDLCKAIVELVYPAIVLHTGGETSQAFCTAIGFLNATFIESTDFAILVIALHTALCIFAPGRGRLSSGEGLYRWRHSIYVLWAVWGLLMASLAFINKERPYVASTSWCYLPVRPFYWRIALSWAPRYAILLFLLGLYISIYIYVKRKFKSFADLFREEDGGMSSQDLSHYSSDFYEPPAASSTVTAPVAELKTHDLLSTQPLASTSTDDGSPSTLVPSVPSVPSVPYSAATIAEGRRASLQPCLTTAKSSLEQEDHLPQLPLIMPASDADDVPSPLPARKQSVISISLPPQLESRRASVMSLHANAPPSSYSGTGNRKQQQQQRLYGSGLHHQPESPTSGFGPGNGGGRSGSLGTHHTAGECSAHEMAQVPMARQRALVVKQLRHLFIYPVVYFLMWLIPFCYHMTQYSDRYIRGPVFPLACISAFIIPLHGFIDVCVYARTEKPWRSVRFLSGAKRRERKAIREQLQRQKALWVDPSGQPHLDRNRSSDRLHEQSAGWWARHRQNWWPRSNKGSRQSSLSSHPETKSALAPTSVELDALSRSISQTHESQKQRKSETTVTKPVRMHARPKADWWDLEEEHLVLEMQHARYQAGLSSGSDGEMESDEEEGMPTAERRRRIKLRKQGV